MAVENRIDITSAQKQIISSLLRQYLPDTVVWIYGSRVKFTAKSHSDLDMVVFSSPELSTKVFLLREALEESNLPFRVDLFIWDDIPESFRKTIRANHIIFEV